MAEIVELVQPGTFLTGLPDAVERDATSLISLMMGRVTDAVLSLGLFEIASGALALRFQRDRESRRAEWEREREAERTREDQLKVERPPPAGGWGDPAYRQWEDEIREEARRDVVRTRWASGELPEAYEQRLPHLHARSFVLSLAQLARVLTVFAKLDTEAARDEIVAARDTYIAALPSVVPVRDSIEHAEERMRSLDRHGNPLTLQPVTNSWINAPGGGVLVGDTLNGRLYTCTIGDGTIAEVEISDATVEQARAAAQRVLDALPWRERGGPVYTPHR